MLETNKKSYELTEQILGGFIPIILIVIGTIGNGLSIIYLCQRVHRRCQSMNIFLICLFVVDTVSLYQWNLNHIVIVFQNGRALSDRSLFLCKSISFLNFYTLHLSALFLCLVTIDRTLILWLRTYRHLITQSCYAWSISFTILLLIFALDGFLLSFGYIDQVTDQIICHNTSNQNLMNFYNNVYLWIHFIPMYILPLMIMIFGMIMMILKLNVRRFRSRHVSRKRRTSWMMVAMCAVYIILTLPDRLYCTLLSSQIRDFNNVATIIFSASALLYLRNASNVFFLFASSHTFRKQLTTLCCLLHLCRYYNRDVNRVVPIQQVQPHRISYPWATEHHHFRRSTLRF